MWTLGPKENENDPNPVDAKIAISIDGTHCPISEPRKEPSTKWYSHKFKGPGLSYEIAIAIHEPKVVWANGPYPAGTNDITIYRAGLKAKMEAAGKLAIADQGYKGEYDTLLLSNPLDGKEVREFKERASARHETFNKSLKEFKILSTRFRSHYSKHQQVFHAALVLTQLDMDTGYPLFDI